MAYVIAEPCIGTKDTACVDACPVDCIHPRKDEANFASEEMLYIDPLECIDCGACGRICPQEAVLDARRNPCRRIPKLSLWPKPVIDLEACISCGICVEGCPARCLASAVDRGDKHLRAALTEPKKCISCGFCVEECPTGAIVLAVPPAPAVEATAG